MLEKVAGAVLILICWAGVVNLAAWLSPQTILVFEVAFVAWFFGWCCGNEEIRSSALRSLSGLKRKPGEAVVLMGVAIFVTWFVFDMLKSSAPFLLALLCAASIANLIGILFKTISRRLGR